MGRRKKKKPRHGPWHGGGRPGRTAPRPMANRPFACKKCGAVPAGPVDGAGRLPCPADGCGGFLARVRD